MQDEASNNFFLGIISQLAHPTKVLMFLVRDRSDIVAAAIMTPARHMMMTDASSQAVRALVEELHQQNIGLPGIQATPEAVDTFANLWTERVGATVHPGLSLGIHRLDAVHPPPTVDGALREATMDDLALLTHWCREFGKEINQESVNPDELARAAIERKRMHLWELESRPVSMAAWTRPTMNGVGINLVYTPAALRGRGYASNCVAALSQSMLDGGKKFCCLYTDLANPTSNKIYRRIGYRRIGRSKQVFFERRQN